MNALAYNRRRWLLATAALSATATQGVRAQQGAPGSRRLLVGFPAGGTADSLARAIGPMLGDASFHVIENKSGATGQLAADTVRQAPADGNTLLLTPSSVLTLAPHLYKKPLYDTLRDFTPVACVCDHAFALAVNGNSPITDLAGFAAWARAEPAKASYATPGPGSAPHFLGVALGQAMGQPLVHVPYRGVAPGLQDLMGGQVASTINPLPTLLEYHRAKRIRILAISNPSRLASLPDVPTFAEAGYPALQLVEWYGLFGPAGLSAATRTRIGDSVQRALGSAEMQAAARRLEVTPRYENGEALNRLVQADLNRWHRQVASTGIQLD